jgi:Ala-tRNA(Pro) deacylase
MTISPRLRSYLDRRGVNFEEVPHAPAKSAAQAAEAAHVKRSQMAKAVLVRVGEDYMVAVVPASQQIAFDRLRTWLGRDVRLANEDETAPLFADCDLGAIPPLGAAYNLETIVDDSLLGAEEVYFEAGDHKTLVHVQAAGWKKLMKDTAHSAFCG